MGLLKGSIVKYEFVFEVISKQKNIVVKTITMAGEGANEEEALTMAVEKACKKIKEEEEHLKYTCAFKRINK